MSSGEQPLDALLSGEFDLDGPAAQHPAPAIEGLDDFLTLNAVLILDDAWNAAYEARNVHALAEVLADDWTGFLPDGQMVDKWTLLTALGTYPEEALTFERHAARLYGAVAVTRGSLSVEGVHVQSFLRVYARWGSQWKAVCVQVVA
jgi:Domain of unknown function (DUF4440)